MIERIKQSARIPRGFGAGVGAAIVMMLVMAVLRFTTNTTSIPELMEERLIHLAGGQLESFFINQLGVGGKALLLVSIVEGTLLLGGLLGFIFVRVWPLRDSSSNWRTLSGILYGLLVGLFLNAVVLPLVDQGFFGSNSISVTAPPDIAQMLYGSSLAPFGIPVPINMFLLSLVFGLSLVQFLPWGRAVTVTSSPVGAGALRTETVTTAGSSVGRRDFMRALGGGAAAIVGGAVLWYGIRTALTAPTEGGVQLVEGDQANTDPTSVTNPPKGTAQPATPVASQTTPEPSTPPPGAVAGATHEAGGMPTAEMTPAVATPPVPAGFENVKPLLVPEVTPVDTFYITTKNFIDPTVDGNSWTFSFKGMVDNPYTITLKDLQALPPMDRIETLACISNPVGGPLISNGRWKGVNFADMLKKAKPQSGVADVIVRGADGYADSFPINAALNNECVLAYELNGKPLTQKHGYPARLLVPGIYGMKNCKWITEVELVNIDFKGYWESQGWSDTAEYQTWSRIDFPNKDNIDTKPIFISGVAFAGNRGIKKVEVTTDGGRTWHDANLRTPMGTFTWVLWTYPWKPEAGTFKLQVRATDGTGETQTPLQQDTYPDGATGFHTKQVRVG